MGRTTQTFSLEHVTTRRLIAEAERLGISRSELCNQLLREAMDRRLEAAVVRLGTAGLGLASTCVFLVAAILLG